MYLSLDICFLFNERIFKLSNIFLSFIFNLFRAVCVCVRETLIKLRRYLDFIGN